MISHVIAIAVTATLTAAAVGIPLAYMLRRSHAETHRLLRQQDQLDAITETVARIDQQAEVNGVRLRKIREELRRQDLSDADTQPVNHLRVIGGYRGSRGA